VVERLREIPYGETRSYAEVAAAAGSPRAVRAVGTACRRNPLPIAIPCHRVVRSDGGLGQYAGGVEAKRVLLGVEGATLAGRDPH
jgi:methylated-DNA-[protein]-cysteine S-methyltransferase